MMNDNKISTTKELGEAGHDILMCIRWNSHTPEKDSTRLTEAMDAARNANDMINKLSTEYEWEYKQFIKNIDYLIFYEEDHSMARNQSGLLSLFMLQAQQA